MTQSPKSILDQAKSDCESIKKKMVDSLQQIPDPKAKTAYQMAINAVDNAVAQCHTASSVIS